jgi:oligopeptide transport system substrate-binding protein
MRRHKPSHRIALLLGALLLCSSCSFSQKAIRKDQLRIALGTEPPSLDPALADTGVSVFVLKQILSTLFEYDSEQRIVASDARSFEWQDQGRTLFIQLRKDLTWSDGKALQACHYRDGWVHALSPKIPSTLVELLFDIEGAEELKASRIGPEKLGVRCDDQKASLTIQVKRPYALRLLHGLAFIVSAAHRKDLYQVHKEKWLVAREGYAGSSSGAYVIASWRHDQKIQLRSRESLGEKNLVIDRKAKIATIDLPIVRDPSTTFVMYESGDLDVIDEIPATLLPKIVGRKDRVISVSPTTYFVGFSVKESSPLQNKNLRRALAMSAGQFEVPQLLRGGETEAKGWIYPELLPEKYRPTASLFNLTEAQKIFKTAGYNAQKKLKLNLYYNNGERHQLLMERLSYRWNTELPVEISLFPIEWKVLVSQIKTNPPELFRYAWTAVYPDPLFFLELFHSKSMNNFGAWKNEEYDQILSEISTVPLNERNEEFYRKVQRAQKILVVDDPALIPIYHYVKNALKKADIQGLSWGLQGMSPLKEVYR